MIIADVHTHVNERLLIGTGVATVFAAPIVLGGVVANGFADYFFDIRSKFRTNKKNKDMKKTFIIRPSTNLRKGPRHVMDKAKTS